MEEKRMTLNLVESTDLGSTPLIVMQTGHEKVVEKIEDDHRKQASDQLLQLKKEFTINFISVSGIIFRLSVRNHRIFGKAEKVKNFCERFSPEERLALYEGIRRHPKYKRCIAFFVTLFMIGVSSFAAWWVVPSYVAILLNGLPVGLSPLFPVMYALDVNFITPVKHFFLRRKLIRLGGPNAPEDAIKEMEQWVDIM